MFTFSFLISVLSFNLVLIGLTSFLNFLGTVSSTAFISPNSNIGSESSFVSTAISFALNVPFLLSSLFWIVVAIALSLFPKMAFTNLLSPLAASSCVL